MRSRTPRTDLCVENRLADAYLIAKESVVAQGFANELASQATVTPQSVTERDFLRESAWVVLCSGFKESVIRNRFPALSRAFFSWHSASLIVENHELCRRRALRAFGSTRKIDAIIRIAAIVKTRGFKCIHDFLLEEPLEFIATLPMMGAITSLHLAKNLGVQVAKPDRHLVRIARATGHRSPQRLCEELATLMHEQISVVDLVLWRYATVNPHYLNLFHSVRV